MKLRVLVPVAALAVLSLLVGAAVVLVRPDAAVPVEGKRSVAEWQQAFVDCANGVMTERVLAMPESEKCILDVMISASDAGQLVEVQDALSAQILLTPPLFGACHNAGHKAGQHVFATRGDIRKLLLENTSTTCQYSIGHGLLDGFAASSPTDEEFQQAADACVQLLESGNHATFAFCADGLGHAAWESTKELEGAVGRCAMVSDGEGRSACAEGVIMQIYEPAGFLPSEDIAEAPEQLPSMCRDWPTDDAELHYGCNSGAGYIYTRPAWKLAVAWQTQNGQIALGPAEAQQMVEHMEWAADMCRKHSGKEAKSSCLRSMSQQTPHVVYLDEELTKRVCGLQGEWASRCEDWKHTLL